ncbi:hypothetical protein, partial [Escherichia coli]|uniref:hypothetical protein n=1 Tax=Escherichia coli TaxID=562 RepID=UPI001BE3EE30
ACYGIKIDHAERETTRVEGKAERLTWHKAWTAVSSGFSISYTSRVIIYWNDGQTKAAKSSIQTSLLQLFYILL